MNQLTPLEAIDYLVIGHITIDLFPEGERLGGTATFAALTAKALGLKVGIVTSWGGELPLGELGAIPIISYPTEKSTTFENIYTPTGRIQRVLHVAPRLEYYQIPEHWRSASIVHLAPVAQEVEPSLVRNFPSALICTTPQGWLRSWDQAGWVSKTEWPEARFVLERCGAAIISDADVMADEERLEEMAAACPVFAVTNGHAGARVFWHGDVRSFRPPPVTEIDPTGAGDIFAATFFSRLYSTRDPWEAARFANQIAAISVTRIGLQGIPTPDEIQGCMIEIS